MIISSHLLITNQLQTLFILVVRIPNSLPQWTQVCTGKYFLCLIPRNNNVRAINSFLQRLIFPPMYFTKSITQGVTRLLLWRGWSCQAFSQTPKYVDQIFQRPQICWLNFQKQNCLRPKILCVPKSHNYLLFKNIRLTPNWRLQIITF